MSRARLTMNVGTCIGSHPEIVQVHLQSTDVCASTDVCDHAMSKANNR